MVTIALALVFLTLEIDKQLAHAGRFDTPIIYRVILASYTILMPNFFLTVWASSKDKVGFLTRSGYLKKQFESDPPNKLVNAIIGLKNKWNKVENGKLLDQTNERKWYDLETILQSLIFVIQVL